MGSPRVELLVWDGCASRPRALAELRDAVAAAGLDPAAIEVREVPDEDAAAREGFPGSPTVRVDGRDVVPIDDPPGLRCRVYRSREGALQPVPDRADVLDALRAAGR